TVSYSVVDGFEKKWGLPQCAGAIDWCHVPISAPAHNHTDYYNGKGFYSIVIQAVIDYRYRFIDVYCGWPGSVHDARIFAHSYIYAKGMDGTLFPSSTE
uniref:DDE Tnp4 domain-containing protein n=1 Tax=Amphimedon queenslandica TaxID=400682 RepID=A0A1X7TF59_AMPQE